MRNSDFKQDDLRDITVDLISKVLELLFSGGYNSFAPLGCSGDDFMLFGESRRREISLRLHSGTVKMLITDNCGGFLFYGGFDCHLLPISFIAKQYFEIIQHVKHLLDNVERNSNLSESDKREMFER